MPDRFRGFMKASEANLLLHPPGNGKMKTRSKPQELLQAQTEIRQLRDTIVALREALEKQKIEHEEHVQSVLSNANDEIIQIKASVVALRDEMENLTIGHEEKMQEIAKDTHNEKKQLQQMIQTLRQQLEEQNSR